MSKKRVILVDHNEKSQAVDGIEEADIVEIIDHHRLGNIETLGPVFFMLLPALNISRAISSMLISARPASFFATFSSRAVQVGDRNKSVSEIIAAHKIQKETADFDAEPLEILIKDLLRRSGAQIAPCGEHVNSQFLNLNSGYPCKSLRRRKYANPVFYEIRQFDHIQCYREPGADCGRIPATWFPKNRFCDDR